LTTKPDLTFDDAKLRLLNTASASASPLTIKMRLPSLPPHPHQKRARKRIRASKKLQLPPRPTINRTTQMVVLGAVNTIPLRLPIIVGSLALN
jgi:hypothetical protein